MRSTHRRRAAGAVLPHLRRAVRAVLSSGGRVAGALPSSGRRGAPVFLMLAAAVVLSLGTAGAAKKPKAGAGETLQKSMEAFWDADYAVAENLAKDVIGKKDAGKEELAEAHKCLACVYVMQDVRRQAIESLVRMFEIDPASRFSPDANYPPPVITTFYAVRDSLFPGTTDINTVAVGDFENNSVYTGKFKNHDFGALSKALPHLITLDLTGATDLKVVDRQRTAEILKEMALSTSGFADPKQAVQAGNLLGAQAYIFGQYMVLSKDRVRIDARIVHTATGEVVVAKQITGTFSGDPEKFMALEKSLVTEIMKTLETMLGSAALENPAGLASAYFGDRAKRIKGRSGYVDGLFLTSEALAAEEGADYKAAIEKWSAVLSADPGNETAAIRIKVLKQTVAQG